MSVGEGTDRRPAVWPWLLMPVIVLVVFYGLNRLQHEQLGSPDSHAATRAEARAAAADDAVDSVDQ